jgi:CheY-like chemotaxis protein
MPKYSGVDFLLDLKHRRPTQLSKVVIVSALEMSSLQEQELLNLGIRSILRKPISVQGLLSQIQQKIAF